MKIKYIFLFGSIVLIIYYFANIKNSNINSCNCNALPKEETVSQTFEKMFKNGEVI